MTCHPDTLLHNLHENIPPVHKNSSSFVRGKYSYYHYCCDSVNDCGWGCGYRTLQTLCSWAFYNIKAKSVMVPSIEEIQTALVNMQDKPKSFIKSREWIGSIEVCYCMDYFFDIPCKLHHAQPNDDFVAIAKMLQEHFTRFGSPVMMGGDQDAASKCILGVSQGEDMSDMHLLILDPHCSCKSLSADQIISDNWLSWSHIQSFDKTSFYNFCLPQAVAKV